MLTQLTCVCQARTASFSLAKLLPISDIFLFLIQVQSYC